MSHPIKILNTDSSSREGGSHLDPQDEPGLDMARKFYSPRQTFAASSSPAPNRDLSQDLGMKRLS